jgi:hypothetical protein
VGEAQAAATAEAGEQLAELRRSITMGWIRALAMCAAVAALVKGDSARACSGGDLVIEEITTFDPAVLGDTWDGLYFNPFSSGFGGGCSACATEAMFADWRGYLAGAIAPMEWKRIVLRGKPSEAAALARSATNPKLRAAAAVIELAQRVEEFATLDSNAELPRKLVDEAQRRSAAAPDAFLRQRYAFLVVRALFYCREWPELIAFADSHADSLAAPSLDLASRARYYVAGALARTDHRARANYELARVHASSQALAGTAAQDFKPMEEADWQDTLRLAKTPRETAELWRLAGVKTDGVVAAREIMKLDPKSDLLALLVVRELAKAESITRRSFEDSPATLAAQEDRALATVEALANAIASTPGADRPWLMELVLGHIAAKRGDSVAARVHLQLAIAARPTDARVVTQAKASLALALAKDWRFDPHREDEIARAMASLHKPFGRQDSVRGEVRALIAKAFTDAGLPVEAELLVPERLDAFDRAIGKSDSPRWHQATFIAELIARTHRTATQFDRFVLDHSHTRAHLQHELALRHLLDGKLAVAADEFRTTRTESAPLGTDPFVVHIRDCHDCDHLKYATSPWTHARFAVRLAELEKVANGTGERAAEASLLLGNALYNITWYGNARSVLASTHQSTQDTSAAERWYKRAFDLTASRELKAKAAYLAAKCERGQLINDAFDDDAFPDLRTPLVPAKWFTVLHTYADTKYAQEVLAECGTYRAWAP